MMNTNVLNAIRTAKGFSRSVAYLIIVAVVGIMLERTLYYSLRKADVIAEEDAVEKLYRIAPHKAKRMGLPAQVSSSQKATEESHESSLSKSVIAAQDTLDVLAYELHRDGGDPNQAQDKLDKLYTQLQAQDQQAMADFREIGRHIQQHTLPDVIKERHDKAVVTYRKEMDTLLGNIRIASDTPDPDTRLEAVMAARKHLEGKQLKRSHQPFDPNNLPHKSVKPNKDNQPKLKQEQFIQAGLFDTPYTQYAALGDFTYGNLAGASNPAYLAETTEVKITQAIRDHAQSLNYEPVQIYHWVRNNIEWLPTWGAMQDADITLGSKRGNAMDIASLLIALLRASQIPARYAHGSIVVPAEQFMNWVGPFTNIEAAATFAASGGIPLVAQVDGGQIKAVRMEHIWVEVATDYQPSRGAVNRDADSWVALDASYKQYENLPGLDVSSISGIDATVLANDLINSGTVNEVESWVSGFDPTVLQSAQTQSQTALENYITTNLPNATVGDVIGGRNIIVQQANNLPSSLPNKLLVTGARYSEIHSALQAKVSLALGKDILGQPIGEVILPWAKINNHKLTLSFKPATVADEATLQSFFPTGEILDISQLPTSLPAYLINVIPEIKLNGQIVTQGQSMTLGQEMDFTFGLRMPGINLGSYSSPIQAGSYFTLAMVGGSVSGQRLTELETQINNTKAILESGDAAQIGTLNREDLLDAMLYAGVLGYYAQNIGFSHITGIRQGVAQNLLPSGGTYGYSPQIRYFFGIPRTLEVGGIEFDLDSVTTVTGVFDGDAIKKKQFVLQTGIFGSALEHGVPEQMFSSQANPGEAVSSVKLLDRANSLGQRVYHINQSNMASVLPNINHSAETMNDIQQALYSGKEVITHTDQITVSGWTGSGYVILDPDVGDGAYLISGGLNGGSYNDSYWSRYFNFISQYLISIDLTSLVGLVLFGSIPKSWVGASALLGSKNPLTSVLRGVLNSPLGKMVLMRALVIPAFTLLGVFIGFFNVTILISGLFYAI